MPRHIVRLVLLMVGFAVLAYGAKQFFTADSFYEYGHYRGKSVAEIASEKPKYKGTTYCTSCHAQQVAEWSNGIHNRPDIGKVVKCEVCHGPGSQHIKDNKSYKMKFLTASADCVSCHDPDNDGNFVYETKLAKIKCPAK